MFLIILTYKNIDLINEQLMAHREYLDRYYADGNFLCSGAQKPRTGGVIVCQAKDRADVERIVSEDPFYIHQAADYSIVEFEATKSTPALGEWLKF